MHECPVVFARRAVRAASSRAAGDRIALVVNGCWDAEALVARIAIVRGAIAALTGVANGEIAVCADIGADERTLNAVRAFVVSMSELAGATVRITFAGRPPSLLRSRGTETLRRAA